MWRRATQQLADLIEQPPAAAAAAAPPRLLIKGPGGSGKSVALVSLVERARARGELVLYVPDARALVSGGFFYKRPEDGSYDTIIAAQHVLKSVVDSHKGRLGEMGVARQEGAAAGVQTLLDLANKGLATDDDVSWRGGGGVVLRGEWSLCLWFAIVVPNQRLT